MSNTATPETLDERLNALEQRLGENSKVSDVSVGYSSGAHVVSYFEEEDGPRVPLEQLKSMRRNKRSRARSMQRLQELRSAGYEPQVRSLDDQLRGIAQMRMNPGSNQAREFEQHYLATRKSMFRATLNSTPEDEIERQMKSLAVNTFDAESGGSLILPEFANEIVGDTHTNDLWPRVRSWPVGGNTMSVPKKHRTSRKDGERGGGVQAAWDGEEMAPTKSRPGVNQVSLKLNKLRAYVLVTDEMLADTSFPIGSFVGECVHEELEFKRGNATVRGTGVGQPLGWLGHPYTIVVDKESGQTAKTIWGENVEEMYRRADMRFINDYFWLANQNALAQLAQLELGGTGPASDSRQLTYLPPNGQADAPYGRIKGRPLVLSEFSSTLGTVGDIAFVNYNDWWAIEKGGIAEATSTHAEFENDLVAYKFTQRMDGRPCEDEPIKPFQGSETDDTLSAFITLATRA